MENKKNKRLFFGMEIHALWPVFWPKGRLLDQEHRHLTLAFLGNVSNASTEKLNMKTAGFPTLSGAGLQVARAGYFDACLLLPPRHPHVVSWHARWFEKDARIEDFQKQLISWLKNQGFSMDEREWTPHVTLCRQPFETSTWTRSFVPLPFFASDLHLYESIGSLNYVSLWSMPLKPPFEEVNHTADAAFLVQGENLQQLYHNSFLSLSFKAPELLGLFKPDEAIHSLDDIIIALNEVITRADGTIGSPFKAVSFHGEICSLPNAIMQWEMIVDV
jgi:2'-5' RNA ligase